MVVFLDDLWRYRMNDSTWTWISSNNEVDQPGSGEKANASTEAVPPLLLLPVGWFDGSTHEFWLFGGFNIYAYGAKVCHCESHHNLPNQA